MDRNGKPAWNAALVAMLAMATASACGSPQEDAVKKAENEAENEAANAAVELKPIDKAGLEKLLAETDAKVVLVDYWGSWCVNCMKKFPHTVEFDKKYGDKGLQVVSLAIEFDPEMGPGSALEFLTKQKATFANFVADKKYEDFDAACEAFDVGPFPTYRLFRKGGERIGNFELGEDHEEIEAAIKKALEDKPAD